jgi:AcrR family transcriptional regulator
MSEHAVAAAKPEPRRARGRPKAADLPELEARLIRVARRTFLAKGYGATSMNEVAKAARVSKGTLYARFPSKADLFRAIIEAQIRHAGAAAAHVGPKPKRLHGMLRLYAERALRESLTEEIVQLNRLIYSEAGRFPELGEAAWLRSRAGVQQVAEHIREYALEEEIPCRNPEAAAEMFTTMLRGFYSDVMLSGRPATMAEVGAWTERMLEVFLAGRRGW